MIRPVTIAFMLCAAAAAGPAGATLIVTPLGVGTADADAPSIAQSPTNTTLVAWQDADLQVWTAAMPTYPAPDASDPVIHHHGFGAAPRVVWTWQGFLLVWTAGTGFYVTYSDGYDFPDPPQYIETWISHTDTVLDVHGLADPGWDVAWIVLEAPSVSWNQVVLMMRLTKGGHEDFALLATHLTYPVGPQVAPLPGWPQPLPRVYYLRDDVMLAYRSEQPDGEWLDEMLLPYPQYGMEFDAAGHPDGTQAILSLGPQPTCPCNVIHAQVQTPDGTWQPPHDLTVNHATYDWPRSPRIRIDGDGRLHAFWLQLGSDAQMIPRHRHLEYWVAEQGSWSDHGDPLDPYCQPGVGDLADLALTAAGHPVFAWTVKDTIAGVPQPRRVMLARPASLVGVEPGLPALSATLTAWPNPFNPTVNLAGRVGPNDRPSLAVFDLRGRLVTSLAIDPAADGAFTARWDGRDADGRAVASGAYVAKLGQGQRAVSRRVVLAR